MRKLVAGVLMSGGIYLSLTVSASLATDREEVLVEHQKKCVRCHGEEGKGDGVASKMLKVKPADWTDADRMSQLSDEELRKIITLGGDSVGKSKLMPAFGQKLTPEQIDGFIALIRSLHSEK